MNTHGILPAESADYVVEEFRAQRATAAGPTPRYTLRPGQPWTRLLSRTHRRGGPPILPHTEADPVALLLQYLASFTSGGRGTTKSDP
jgi:hypothetical protein